MKDYSYLEGKRFMYNNWNYSKPAQVLYADYEIGLTCVNVNNPDNYLICLNGPSSPNPITPSRIHWEAIWNAFVTHIERGKFRAEEGNKILEKYGIVYDGVKEGPDSSVCAFGQ